MRRHPIICKCYLCEAREKALLAFRSAQRIVRGRRALRRIHGANEGIEADIALAESRMYKMALTCARACLRARGL